MRTQALIAPILVAVVAAACTETGPTEVEAEEEETEPPVTAVERADAPAATLRTTSAVSEFPNGAVIPGASARLMRGKNGVNAWLQTNSLTPGNAYTLWIVVFNNPSECIVPNECRLADVNENDPAVGVDLLIGSGMVAGGSGRATFTGRVKIGDTGLRGVGLLDAFEPEIHLIVRTHGPKLSGAAQLKEFGGGCDVNDCANVQDALHF